MGTRLSPNCSAISLRSNRSPERSLPVRTRFTTCETTRSFSLTPYFLGMARSVSHAAACGRAGSDPRVAPAAQRFGVRQVVLRAVDADGEQRDAEADERLGVGEQF